MEEPAMMRVDFAEYYFVLLLTCAWNPRSLIARDNPPSPLHLIILNSGMALLMIALYGILTGQPGVHRQLTLLQKQPVVADQGTEVCRDDGQHFPSHCLQAQIIIQM